jgi:hypothetical protein
MDMVVELRLLVASMDGLCESYLLLLLQISFL